MSYSKKRIAIIGAGPAGLAAAIAANQHSIINKKSTEILIFEQSNRLGKTILQTGNGRCNFSNLNIEKAGNNKYFNWEFVEKVQATCHKNINKSNIFYNNKKLISQNLLEFCGIWTTSIDNKLYPRSLKSSTVVECLESKIKDFKIKTKLNTQIKSLYTDKQFYVLEDNNNQKYKVDSVIISTGGGPTNLFNNSINIKSFKRKFVLGPIETHTTIPKNLDGVKVKVKLKLNDNNKTCFEECGELLFRKYGISGIVTFNCSRFLDLTKKQILHIDLFPDISYADLYKKLSDRYMIDNKPCSIETLCKGIQNVEITKAIIKFNKKLSIIDQKNIDLLVGTLKDLKLVPNKVYTKVTCQVSRGGVDVNTLNAELNHKKFNRLFFAGEVIDVDGACGGYNLDWAWTSGILAGIRAVKEINED